MNNPDRICVIGGVSPELAQQVYLSIQTDIFKDLIDCLVNEASMRGFALQRGPFDEFGLSFDDYRFIGPTLTRKYLKLHWPSVPEDELGRVIQRRIDEGWSGKLMTDIIRTLRGLGWVFTLRHREAEEKP